MSMSWQDLYGGGSTQATQAQSPGNNPVGPTASAAYNVSGSVGLNAGNSTMAWAGLVVLAVAVRVIYEKYAG